MKQFLFSGFLAVTLLAGCTPALKEVFVAEWQAVKTHDYKGDLSTLTGISRQKPITRKENTYTTYCGTPTQQQRVLVVEGLSEPVVQGGCILDKAPADMPARLQNRF